MIKNFENRERQNGGIFAELRRWGGNDAPRKKICQDQAILPSPKTPGALDSCVTCQNARSEKTNVNMYEKAEVSKNKCAGEKPTTCGIKACIYMCEGKKTHAYACYGHTCTAQCTCNVVCMCGKKHAQESGNNNNNDIKSSKIIRFKNMYGTK